MSGGGCLGLFVVVVVCVVFLFDSLIKGERCGAVVSVPCYTQNTQCLKE